jgi:phage tail-like protein
MARAEASDPLHNFRFHVTTENGFAQYVDSELGEAGFQSVTLPELSVETVEYREGIHTYTRKFAGVPSVSDMTMMRGVTKSDTAFYDWVRAAAEGGNYRTNLTVYQWHRDGKQSVDKIADVDKARKYVCFECVPSRVKPGADLDATSSDVSLAELDVACEYFRIENAG